MAQKGLKDYLETKRAAFARFYFLSHDELLEILSQSKDPTRVVPFLSKVFEAVNKAEFQPDNSSSNISDGKGEVIEVVTPVEMNRNWRTLISRGEPDPQPDPEEPCGSRGGEVVHGPPVLRPL